MKIVYLSASDQLGGAENSLLEILACLREAGRGWSLHLVVPGGGPLGSRAAALGIPTTLAPFPPSFARFGDWGGGQAQGNRLELWLRFAAAAPAATAYAVRLRFLLRALTPDVIHANGFKMHVLTVLARPPRTPVIWHVHDYVRNRPVAARLLRWQARQGVMALVNSDSVGSDLKPVCGPTFRIRRIYNAVDLDRFSPQGPRLDLDALSGLPPAPPGTVRIGLVGTLGRWKGHGAFFRALSLIPAALRVRGYVVGGPIYHTNGSQYTIEQLRRLAGDSGVLQNVGFTGFVHDVPSTLRALDIVVHASIQPEPFGLAIVEAMACGRAVIAAQAGGAAEIFRDGVDALGHPPGDAGALAHRITELVADEDLRHRLGNAGRATAERYFDRARLTSEVVALYQEAVGGGV
jgi:glycosyltransferase involved in cell wall biosynthesis